MYFPPNYPVGATNYPTQSINYSVGATNYPLQTTNYPVGATNYSNHGFNYEQCRYMEALVRGIIQRTDGCCRRTAAPVNRVILVFAIN